MWSAISTSAVPASSSIPVPAVSASVYGVEVRASEEEVVSARVSCVDGEMPVASVPVEWAIEVSGSQEGSVLPVEENVAQVGVALSPVCSIQVVVSVYPHEVIQVHFVCSLILVVGKIQLVCHLIGQKESLLASLLVTHGRCGRNCHCEQCHHS